jgi:hypothetical protein
MSGFGAALAYLAVVVVLLAAYKIIKRRVDRAKPRFGDADAYEGNLATPSAGEHRHPPVAGELHSGAHAAHGGRPFRHTGNTDHIPPGVLGGGRR